MGYYWLGEPFLYSCFALLTGWLIMTRTSTNLKVPRKLLFGAVLGIGIFSFFPILRIMMFFAEDLGFMLTFRSVLFLFVEGKAYLWTLFFTLCFGVILRFASPETDRRAWICSILLLVGMMGAQGWTSHVASLYGIIGFVSQTLHLYALSIWAGTLLIAAWFLPNSQWKSYIAWFHPTAIIAMIMIVASGFTLMVSVVPEYVNSWVLPYGQALLLKHLLLVPLIVLAIFNGWWMKKKMTRDTTFDPKPWAKAEGVIVLLIFSITGFMNQQSPPHNVSDTLRESPASPLYLGLHGEIKNGDVSFRLELQPISYLFLGLAFLSLLLIIRSLREEKQPRNVVFSGILFVVFMFISALTALASRS